MEINKKRIIIAMRPERRERDGVSTWEVSVLKFKNLTWVSHHSRNQNQFHPINSINQWPQNQNTRYEFSFGFIARQNSLLFLWKIQTKPNRSLLLDRSMTYCTESTLRPLFAKKSHSCKYNIIHDKKL